MKLHTARYFVLEAIAGPEDTEITSRREVLKGPHPGDYMHPELADLTDWVTNVYSSSRIRPPTPPKQDTRISCPVRVLVDGEPYFFRAWHRSARSPEANSTELRSYKQIQDALTSGQTRHDLRICRLHGVVVDTDDGTSRGGDVASRAIPGQRLVGILLTFIVTNQPRRIGTVLQGTSRGLLP